MNGRPLRVARWVLDTMRSVYYEVIQMELTMSADLSDPISLRLPVEMLKSIERVAEASDRTRSWVIVRALADISRRKGRIFWL